LSGPNDLSVGELIKAFFSRRLIPLQDVHHSLPRFHVFLKAKAIDTALVIRSSKSKDQIDDEKIAEHRNLRHPDNRRKETVFFGSCQTTRMGMKWMSSVQVAKSRLGRRESPPASSRLAQGGWKPQLSPPASFG